jgi:hypothetical protein
MGRLLIKTAAMGRLLIKTAARGRLAPLSLLGQKASFVPIGTSVGGACGTWHSYTLAQRTLDLVLVVSPEQYWLVVPPVAYLAVCCVLA